MDPYSINSKEYKLLKYLSKHPRTAGEIKKRFNINNEKLGELLKGCSPYISYMGRNFSDSTKITIKNTGIILVEHRFRLDFCTRLPLFLSILALIISGLSIVLSPFFNAFFTQLYGL